MGSNVTGWTCSSATDSTCFDVCLASAVYESDWLENTRVQLDVPTIDKPLM
jgi:hypothetical protein